MLERAFDKTIRRKPQESMRYVETERPAPRTEFEKAPANLGPGRQMELPLSAEDWDRETAS